MPWYPYIIVFLCFFFYLCGDHRDLHSFPTRRSSDLPDGRRGTTPANPPPAPLRTPAWPAIPEVPPFLAGPLLECWNEAPQCVILPRALRRRRGPRIPSDSHSIADCRLAPLSPSDVPESPAPATRTAIGRRRSRFQHWLFPRWLFHRAQTSRARRDHFPSPDEINPRATPGPSAVESLPVRSAPTSPQHLRARITCQSIVARHRSARAALRAAVPNALAKPARRCRKRS